MRVKFKDLNITVFLKEKSTQDHHQPARCDPFVKQHNK